MNRRHFLSRIPLLALGAGGATLAANLVANAQAPRTQGPGLVKTPQKGVAPRLLPNAIATPKPTTAKTAEPRGPTGPDDPYCYPLGDLVNKRGEIVTMQGNGRILYKDTKFQSEKVLYNEETQIGSAPGKLQIDDAQNTINGARGEAFYKLKIAKIIGDVVIVARPKPADGKPTASSTRREFKEPVTITCNSVQYNWKTRVADPSGNIRIQFTQGGHRWNMTSDTMQYRGKEEVVLLKGNVFGKNERDETFQFEDVKLVITEGAETMDGNVYKGRHKIDDEEDGAAPKPAPVKPGVAKPPVGGPAKPGETKPGDIKPGDAKPVNIPPPGTTPPPGEAPPKTTPPTGT